MLKLEPDAGQKRAAPETGSESNEERYTSGFGFMIASSVFFGVMAVTIRLASRELHPFEIAFHDRGPMDSTKLVDAGSWSAYWYNGVIVSSEISRGLDIFELVPSPLLSQNEIDAAKLEHLNQLNTQGQPQYVFMPSFALTRAYVDQLERSNGLPTATIASTRSALAAAEKLKGDARKEALTQLAGRLNAEVRGSSDAAKAGMLVNSVRDLANTTK